MKTSRAALGALVIGSMASIAVMQVGSAEPVPERVTLGDPVSSVLNLTIDGSLTERIPVLPVEAIPTLGSNSSVTFGKNAGLTSVSATLNGQRLNVSDIDGAFVVDTSTAEGEGAGTLIVAQSFSDGTSAVLPYTIYFSNDNPPRETDIESGGIRATTERVLTWGTAEGQVGRLTAKESETLIPGAIAATSDGTLLVLDTVNQRVVNGSEARFGTIVADLPGIPYLAFATSTGPGKVLAIDPINGTSVDVATGAIITLPALTAALPADTDYSLDENGTLFVPNPADGVRYSIAQMNGDQFRTDGNIERILDEPRVWRASSNEIAFQSTPTEPAITIRIDDAADLAIIDSVHSDNGEILLVAVGDGKSYTTRLVHISTDGEATSLDIPFNAALTMTSHLAATGSTVTVASAEDDGLHLRSYRI